MNERAEEHPVSATQRVMELEEKQKWMGAELDYWRLVVPEERAEHKQMRMELELRLITMADSELLLEWRNDPETRQNSHTTGVVEEASHEKYLRNTIANPNRNQYIALENGIPVGTVRSDWIMGNYTISWTVAPSARGRGVGKQMVSLFVSGIIYLVRAEIKKENIASIKIAEYAGMIYERQEEDILHYARERSDSNE